MKRFKPIFLVVLLLCLAGGIFWKVRGSKNNDSPQKHTVQRGKIEVTVVATGVVQPENRLELKPAIAGRIEKVLVEEGSFVKKGQILGWMSSTERATLLDAALPKGKSAVAYWESLYPPIPIVAPLSGTLIVRNINPGQNISPSDVLFVIADHLIVKAQLDETDIGKIKKSLSARLSLDAYPDLSFTGQVHRIDYESQTVNNVTIYQVHLFPHNAPTQMKSGMSSQVTFILQKKENVLLIPESALKRRGKKRAMVQRLTPSGKPETLKIKLGLSDGKNSEVLSGLTEGDVLLIPTLKLEKGKKGSNPFSPMRGGGGRSGDNRRTPQ